MMDESQKEKLIKKLELLRAEMNEKIDSYIRTVQEGKNLLPLQAEDIPLQSAHLLKGRKPTAVLWGEKKCVETSTWMKVVEIVLADCNRQAECHQRLIEMCNRVFGRSRILLTDDAARLRRPVQVGNEEMFFEAYFDTETLVKVLILRILEPVGYDYAKIKVRCL